jgi:hypothetical protein
VDITADTVESVTQKLSGSDGPGGINSVGRIVTFIAKIWKDKCHAAGGGGGFHQVDGK